MSAFKLYNRLTGTSLASSAMMTSRYVSLGLARTSRYPWVLRGSTLPARGTCCAASKPCERGQMRVRTAMLSAAGSEGVPAQCGRPRSLPSSERRL